jgi:methyltransferase (TIGR00027 family)
LRQGEASVTAQRVASHRLGFTRLRAPYGRPQADDQLARDVAGRVAAASSEGMVRYLAARTAFFDRMVVGALDRGVTQVVITAAGYDGRALRYAKPGVRFFEVDHPDTQADKRQRLERLGIDASHIAFASADFIIDDVGAELTAASLDPKAAALFLCEGVAVYLDRPVLESLLGQLRAVAGRASRLAISLSVDSGSRASRPAPC